MAQLPDAQNNCSGCSPPSRSPATNAPPSTTDTMLTPAGPTPEQIGAQPTATRLPNAQITQSTIQ